MKKIIYSILLVLPILGIATKTSATTTVISLPTAGDTVGGILDWANPFITAFWPILLAVVGIGVVFWVIGKITNKF